MNRPSVGLWMCYTVRSQCLPVLTDRPQARLVSPVGQFWSVAQLFLADILSFFSLPHLFSGKW